ncbi:MAG: insulinase family protein, partial [Nitrospinota bacterium]|nr:insulinase family protein [Nitrospinota bacterium]
MKQQKEKDFYKSKLSNGIPVVAANIPYLRSISIGIWFKAGSRNEIPELNGIFHFLEHLAFKGTNRRSAHQ